MHELARWSAHSARAGPPRSATRRACVESAESWLALELAARTVLANSATTQSDQIPQQRPGTHMQSSSALCLSSSNALQLSRRDLAQAIGIGAAATVAPVANAADIKACQKGANNCWSTASTDKTSLKPWTFPQQKGRCGQAAPRGARGIPPIRYNRVAVLQI